MANQLPIKLDDLELAFGAARLQAHFYLDIKTGEVVTVTDEIRDMLESILEDVYEDGQEVRTFADIVRERDLPEWLQEGLRIASDVDMGFGSRFIDIPRIESRESYRWMERFIGTVDDRGIQEQLWYAINGRHPFRRFKDALESYPTEREHWFAFEAAELRRSMRAWLEKEGIEPIVNDT